MSEATGVPGEALSLALLGFFALLAAVWIAAAWADRH